MKLYQLLLVTVVLASTTTVLVAQEDVEYGKESYRDRNSGYNLSVSNGH